MKIIRLRGIKIKFQPFSLAIKYVQSKPSKRGYKNVKSFTIGSINLQHTLIEKSLNLKCLIILFVESKSSARFYSYV